MPLGDEFWVFGRLVGLTVGVDVEDVDGEVIRVTRGPLGCVDGKAAILGRIVEAGPDVVQVRFRDGQLGWFRVTSWSQWERSSPAVRAAGAA